MKIKNGQKKQYVKKIQKFYLKCLCNIEQLSYWAYLPNLGVNVVSS